MGDTSKRGFASMDPEKRREITSKGGKAAQAGGLAHRFTSETGKIAGKKGGAANGANKYRWDSASATAAGKKSAETRRKKRRGRKS